MTVIEEVELTYYDLVTIGQALQNREYVLREALNRERHLPDVMDKAGEAVDEAWELRSKIIKLHADMMPDQALVGVIKLSQAAEADRREQETEEEGAVS